MNLEIPKLKCSIIIEKLNPNGTTGFKSSHSNSSVILGRNQNGQCVLSILDNKSGKQIRQFSFSKTHMNYQLATKFVHEGKASMTIKDMDQRIFFSNCPPNDLSLFLKGFALKCNNYGKINPNLDQSYGLMTRPVTKLLQNSLQQNSTIEKISPLTTKDLIKNLDKSKLLQSPVTSKKTFNKRKLETALNTIQDSSPNTRKRLVQSIIPSPVRALKLLNTNNLTDEQHSVLSSVLRGTSLFFTGSAGTGKSYLLKFIIDRLPPESTYVTASTGIAASHIGGITLHMFSGIPTTWLQEIEINNVKRKLTPKEIAQRMLKNETKVQRWKQCKCLIVDEISMVSGCYFETLNEVAKIIRKNDKPFGGIQLILCGDFLQLPPIQTRGENKIKYSFQTKCWDETIKQCFELRKIKRQTDQTFINVLNLLRIGQMTDTIKNTLIKTSTNDLRKSGIIPTQLYTHRIDVDRVNLTQMSLLTNQQMITFNATDSDPAYAQMFDTICPTPRKLQLKIGAQVMINKNIDIRQGIVNGLTGTIIKFEREDKNRSDQQVLPKVRFVNGVERLIGMEKWSIKLGVESRSISRTHLPLQLAWAISIHKSQGMTISNGVEISLAKVFESGQAYVALSRATSLTNVKIIDFNPDNIVVDSEALDFYKKLY